MTGHWSEKPISIKKPPQITDAATLEEKSKRDNIHNIAPLFHSISNEDISERELFRIHQIRLILTELMEDSEHKTISDITQYFMENISHDSSGTKRAIQARAMIPVNYTLLACLALDAEIKGYEDLFSDTRIFGRSRLDRDIFENNGINAPWKAVGIINQRVKRKAVSLLMSRHLNSAASTELQMSVMNTSLLKYCGFNTLQDMTIMITNYYHHCDVIDRSFIPEARDFIHMCGGSFIYMNEEIKKKEVERLMSAYDDTDEFNPFFSWLVPLCQEELINGSDFNHLIENVSPIIDVILESMGIDNNSPLYIELKRRCNIHIAMGFEDALVSLSFAENDILPVAIDNNNHDLTLIAQSPLLNNGGYECDSAFYNNLAAIRKSGVELNLNSFLGPGLSYVDGDHSPLTLFISTSDDKPSVIRELIKTPLWIKDKELSLIFQYLGERVNYDHDIQLAIFDRMSRKLRTDPGQINGWSRKEQRVLAKDLIDRDALTLPVYKYINFDEDIVKEQKSNLPRDIVRAMLEGDLGL